MDRILAWRDGLLQSPRFRRRAAAFPLTRPIARHHARSLFDLVAGFVYSQVLLACVQLRLFDVLSTGPLARRRVGRALRPARGRHAATAVGCGVAATGDATA
jgi:demethylspheroidene O-methyltransferase